MVVQRYFKYDKHSPEHIQAIAIAMKNVPQSATDINLKILLEQESFPKELKEQLYEGYDLFARILSIAGKHQVELSTKRFRFAMNEYGNAKVVIRQHNHYDRTKDEIVPLDIPTFRLETRGELNKQTKLK